MSTTAFRLPALLAALALPLCACNRSTPAPPVAMAYALDPAPAAPPAAPAEAARPVSPTREPEPAPSAEEVAAFHAPVPK